MARDFILKEFLPGEMPENLTDSTELITDGILDSLATLKLVAYLEKSCGIEIAPDELVPENLNSIAQIANFVQSKQAST
ncbi:MAG: acyl carrier protein [Mesorhizobium sp.]|nr:MAG: acyl carrier protein [Mesorhizobium sp.]RWH87502.1 MAG: acyl carrier protein [Mesorhizobium sp.]RWH93985.1 MAG: acyl carrier protein [Mesorhizobium sp.]RWI03231.1 MAG: acyl carrier protein [Mesorhizobium sp.]RWI05743.1 MAG: acyl carrier protein [Mesorhizobium sp.]